MCLHPLTMGLSIQRCNPNTASRRPPGRSKRLDDIMYDPRKHAPLPLRIIQRVEIESPHTSYQIHISCLDKEATLVSREYFPEYVEGNDDGRSEIFLEKCLDATGRVTTNRL